MALLGGGRGVLDSQGRFVLHKRNFFCLSTETLDDATILCVFKKLCKSVSDVIIQKEHCVSKWLKRHASSESQQGCHRQGALNLRCMAGKRRHLSSNLMLTMSDL